MTQQLDLGREVLAVLPRADLAPGRSELLKMAKLRVDIKDVQVELQSTKDALSEARSKVSSLQQKLEASDSRALAAERLNKHWEDAMRELLADHGVEAPDRVGPELAVLLSRRQ
ncbi:hypothetical protein BD324DRAFT_285667 [Kockovaella imperatae]|uniref:Uncharacterized protein n=1 Tax=Kockovaella imperatae TaxID=4999 RepID=A0A1Y1U5S3_9TREE|nr:hypothetical protein BD324DRAFT_285667 [Kockovaella imperatae]ORX33342.1 hypothetical protein BD324DRAFT_285667 [Kockovaella imperatae]